MDPRVHGWAAMMLATLPDAASDDERRWFVAAALDAALECGKREGRESAERDGKKGWD